MYKVTILGCGSSGGVPLLGYGWGNCDSQNIKNLRSRSSILIESKDSSILIDMSPDIKQQLIHKNVAKIKAVIFTHAHYDHTNGINELRPIFLKQKKDLQVYGTSTTLKEIQSSFSYLFENAINQNIYRPYIKSNILTPYSTFEICDICGISFLQNHGFSNSLGIRINNFAYCTDVVDFPSKSLDLLHNLDVLIIDCLSKYPKPSHAHIEKVCNWVKILKPKITFLTHMDFSMDYDTLISELPDNIRPAYDGLELIL